MNADKRPPILPTDVRENNEKLSEQTGLRFRAARAINAMQDLVVNAFHWHRHPLGGASAAQESATAVFALRETLDPEQREVFDTLFTRALADKVKFA
jgi:hypothetical protein